MYLFTRSGRLAPGNLAAQMQWAMTMTEKVNQVAELDIALWTNVLSPGAGTLNWVTTFDDLAALEASDDKLTADTGYQLLAEEGARFISAEGINDALMQFVTPVDAPAPDAPQPNYAWVVTGTLAQGALVKGME